MFALAGLAFSGLGAAQAVTPSQLAIAQMVVESAGRYPQYPQLAQLALGIASHESGFDPSALNPNGGAAGVMQLMPGTSSTMGVSNPMDAQQNIDGGVSLLAQLLAKYNGDSTLALWAYSNGSGSVTAGGSNPSNMPAQAAGLVSYVDSYTPPASLDLSTLPVDDGSADSFDVSSIFDFSSASSFFGGMNPMTLALGATALAVLAIVSIEGRG